MNSLSQKLILAIIIVVVATLFARTLILDGASKISLAPAPQLSGYLAQSIGVSKQSGELLSPGKDFMVTNVKYYNNRWAVATVKPINNSFDGGVVVIEKIDNVYSVVLGPTGEFSDSYIYVLPSSVVNDIASRVGFSG